MRRAWSVAGLDRARDRTRNARVVCEKGKVSAERTALRKLGDPTEQIRRHVRPGKLAGLEVSQRALDRSFALVARQRGSDRRRHADKDRAQDPERAPRTADGGDFRGAHHRSLELDPAFGRPEGWK